MYYPVSTAKLSIQWTVLATCWLIVCRDLSETSITHLPTGGLEGLDVLRIEDTQSLKVIPSVYSFKVSDSYSKQMQLPGKVRSEDAFVVITCVANLMEVKFLYVQQDLRYEISSYWRFNV
jgi:hypothetical protein